MALPGIGAARWPGAASTSALANRLSTRSNCAVPSAANTVMEAPILATVAKRSRLSSIEQLMFFCENVSEAAPKNFFRLGGACRLIALHIRDEHGITGARLAGEARHDRRRVGHLWHPFGRHER